MSDLSKQDWADWIGHPCSKAFFAHLDTEWGAGGQRFERMFEKIADQVGDDAMNMRQMQQIAIARREIMRLKEWPSEQIQRLKALEPQPVGQSRRGTL
jgi:hypothetical protein